MRICLLTPELPPNSYGGIGQYVLTLARQFRRRGHEVVVAGPFIHRPETIAHEWGSSISLGRPDDGARKSPLVARAEGLLTRAFDGLAGVPMLWRVGHAWRTRHIVRGAYLIRRYLQRSRDRFDVVEIPNYPGHGALLPHTGAPYVVRLSTPAAEGGSAGNLALTALERRTCRHAARVIANSDAMKLKGQAVYGLDADSISVIPHGLDDVPQPERHADPNVTVMTYCGRAEARKGTDIFIRALADVLPDVPALRIRIIRGDFDQFATAAGPDLADVWRTLKRNHGHQFEIVGTVDDQTRDTLLANSDWTVIPSRYESFGLVAIESMRVGTPIIAADTGGLGEVGRSSVSNVLYPPESVAGLSAALRQAAREPLSSRQDARQRSRQVFVTEFLSERMASSTLDVYQGLL